MLNKIYNYLGLGKTIEDSTEIVSVRTSPNGEFFTFISMTWERRCE